MYQLYLKYEKWELLLSCKSMGKLFFRVLLIVALTCFFPIGNIFAKIAPLSIKELRDRAEIVAIVDITATELTNEFADAAENGVPKKLILHHANTLEVIKGSPSGKDIRFLNVNGLTTGQKYIVFLDRKSGGALTVSFLGYGALIIYPIAMKAVRIGLVEAVRVPTVIFLPKALNAEVGVVDRHESSSTVWVGLSVLLNYLKI